MKYSYYLSILITFMIVVSSVIGQEGERLQRSRLSSDIDRRTKRLYEHHKDIEGSKWKIGGPWNILMCNTSSIGCFYVGWNIWPEAIFTKYIEEIYLTKGKKYAYHAIMETLF